MLERRTEGSPVRSPQLGSLFLFPKVEQFLKGNFGPVNVPRITVVLGQQFQPFFPCHRIADDLNDGVLLFIETNGFLDDVRAAALPGQPGNGAISVR